MSAEYKLLMKGREGAEGSPAGRDEEEAGAGEKAPEALEPAPSIGFEMSQQRPRAKAEETLGISRPAAVAAFLAAAALLTLGVSAFLQEEATVGLNTGIPDYGRSFTPPKTSDRGGSAFDEAEAYMYMQYARASFCSEQKLRTWDCGRICRDAPIEGRPVIIKPGRAFAEDGYIAMVDSVERKCVVAFRGSVNLQNLEGASEFYPAAWPLEGSELAESGKQWCPGCTVHVGWAKTYEELRKPLFEGLRTMGCGSVALTGHSLGGVVAMLAAIEIRAVLGLLAGPIYAFGAPRVGNAAFVRAFEKAAALQGQVPPLWRVVHYRDWVPHLPPHGASFVHVPQEVFYETTNSDRFIVCDPEVGEDPTCANRNNLAQLLLYPSDHQTYMNLSTQTTFLSRECSDYAFAD